MFNIITTLTKLGLENTDKGKKEILSQTDEFSKWVFKQTFDPSIKYYIKQIPTYTPIQNNDYSDNNPEDLIMVVLNNIKSNKIRGNQAYDLIQNTLNQLNEDYCQVLIGILTKNLYVDVGPKTLLDVFGKDFFFIPPYMRCFTQEKGFERITYPALIQLKADGAFVNVIIEPSKKQVTFMTRNGNILELPVIETKILEYCLNNDIHNDIVLHGEMMINNASLDNRSEGNGLVNKLINKENSEQTLQKKINEAKTPSSKDKLLLEYKNKLIEWDEIENNIYIECWDCVQYDNWKQGYEPILYIDRFNYLVSKFNNENNIISIIDHQYVDSAEEALNYYEKKKAEGLEGAVLKQITYTKDVTTYWKDHTSPGQVKLKGLHVVEMKCVDFNYGDENSPFKNFIGNLVCETNDGLFRAKISGLSYRDKGIYVNDKKWSEAILDKDGNFQLNPTWDSIQDFFNDVFKDKIISVQFNDVTVDKNKKPSLQFAQYKGIRTDSNNIDTLHYILEMTNKLDKVEL